MAKELSTFTALLEPSAVRLAVDNSAYGQEDLEALEDLGRRVGELEERIDRGDPDRAAETVREHIEAAGVALLARMEELDLGPRKA